MKECSICNKEVSDFQGSKCPVCGRFICFSCSSKHCVNIDIEDFEYSFVCNRCATKELSGLIENAKYTDDAMTTAQSNHYKACDNIRDEIRKLKGENDESTTVSNDF